MIIPVARGQKIKGGNIRFQTDLKTVGGAQIMLDVPPRFDQFPLLAIATGHPPANWHIHFVGDRPHLLHRKLVRPHGAISDEVYWVLYGQRKFGGVTVLCDFDTTAEEMELV
jgi:hypothetical protein